MVLNVRVLRQSKMIAVIRYNVDVFPTVKVLDNYVDAHSLVLIMNMCNYCISLPYLL